MQDMNAVPQPGASGTAILNWINGVRAGAFGFAISDPNGGTNTATAALNLANNALFGVDCLNLPTPLPT